MHCLSLIIAAVCAVGATAWQSGDYLVTHNITYNHAVLRLTGDRPFVLNKLDAFADMPVIYDRAGVTHNGLVYFIGGWGNNGEATARVTTISSGMNTTVEGTPLPDGRNQPTAVVTCDKEILVCGGFDSGRETSSACWTSTGGPWTTATPLPDVRGLHAMVSVSAGVLVFGGHGSASTHNTVWMRACGEDAWTTRTSMPATVHSHAAVALNDDTVLVCGGWVDNDDVGTNKCWTYSVAADAWTPAKDMLHERWGHKMVSVKEGQAHIIGGPTDVVEAYTPDMGGTDTGLRFNNIYFGIASLAEE